MKNELNHFFVTTQELDLADFYRMVVEDRYGAVARFIGTVRSPNAEQTVIYIDYEGYESMIQTQMQIIADELRVSYDLGHLVLAHRLGKLKPGEASIAIVASSEHRRDALLACQEGIDRAKDLLPVWKYEVGDSQTTWVEGKSVAAKPIG